MRRRNKGTAARTEGTMSGNGWEEQDDPHAEQSEPLLGPRPAPREERVHPVGPSSSATPPPGRGASRTNPCWSLAAWFAACCGGGSGGGGGGGRRGAPAEIQSYSDFALLAELPLIDSLRAGLAQRCDFTENTEHEGQLQALRGRLRPDSVAEGFDWRTLGFQSANSRTDFRGAGLAGLRCLAHLAEHYPEEYRAYLAVANHESRPAEASPGTVSYPCSASALAFVLVLVYRLKLTVRPPLMSPDCGTDIQKLSTFDRDDLRTFLRLVAEEPSQDKERVFRELFCAGVAVMHSVWVSEPRQELDIMNFNKLTYLPAWQAVQAALLAPEAVHGTQSLEQVCAAVRAAAARL